MGDEHAGGGCWASQGTQDSSSQVKSLPCCVAAGAAGAPVVCVVCETALAQSPLLWPWQQEVAKTTSARSTRKGHDAGVLQWPCKRRWAVEERAEPWERAQVCFRVVRQAEMWVRSSKAGLLLEKS